VGINRPPVSSDILIPFRCLHYLFCTDIIPLFCAKRRPSLFHIFKDIINKPLCSFPDTRTIMYRGDVSLALTRRCGDKPCHKAHDFFFSCSINNVNWWISILKDRADTAALEYVFTYHASHHNQTDRWRSTLIPRDRRGPGIQSPRPDASFSQSSEKLRTTWPTVFQSTERALGLRACSGTQGLFLLKFPAAVRVHKADFRPLGGSGPDRRSVNCSRKWRSEKGPAQAFHRWSLPSLLYKLNAARTAWRFGP